jgi:hypothetical protein
MHVVGHDFHFQDLRTGFDSNLSRDDPQSLVDPFHKNPAAVFRAPHHVVLTGVDDISVALVVRGSIIQQARP